MPDLRLLWASWRWRLRPALHWLVAAAVGGAAVAGYLVLARQASAARAAWGERRAVVVAAADLPPGHVLTPGDVDTVQVPAGLVPPGAVATVPPGATLSAAVFAGEPVLDQRLAPPGASPLAAMLGPDERAVAVGRAEADLVLHPGDQVQLVTDRPLTTGRVLAVGDLSVTVAVPATDLDATAVALVQQQVVLALAPPPPAAE